MNNKPICRKFIIFLLVFLIPLTLVACGKAEEPETTNSQLDNALELYNTSVSALDSNATSYDVEIEKETAIEDEVFREKRIQSITKNGVGTAEQTFEVEETLTIGDHTASIKEVYHDGNVYISLSGVNFRSKVTQEEYTSRYAPLFLFDTTLYKSVTGYQAEEYKVIEFTEPTGPENWLWDNDSLFENATGFALISNNGQLLSCTYTTYYRVDNIHITMVVTTTPNDGNMVIDIPSNLDSYTQLSNPEAPKMLEKACGYLTDAASISATYTDHIECTAFEDRRRQIIQIDAISEPNWTSYLHTTLKYLDHSKSGSETIVEKAELFADGKYSIQIDNGSSYYDDTVSSEMMRVYCQDILVGTIMLPEHIKDAEIAVTESTYDIRYTANAEFAEQMRNRACEVLYEDPDILTEQTESYSTETAMCYLRLDKVTGLPVASGFYYSGTFTKDSLPYRLMFKADQEYHIINDTALSNVQSLA